MVALFLFLTGMTVALAPFIYLVWSDLYSILAECCHAECNYAECRGTLRLLPGLV